VFLINSREGLFVATSQAPPLGGFTQVGTPLLPEEYGASLQSSLTIGSSTHALEFSSHQLVSGITVTGQTYYDIALEDLVSLRNFLRHLRELLRFGAP